jgi:hypothetical protein
MSDTPSNFRRSQTEAMKTELKVAAVEAEMKGDYRKAADLYGQVFRMECNLNGMTTAAKNQMRCMFAAWRLECQ